MTEKIKGYRTIIIAAFLIAYAAAGMIGIDVPNPDGEEAMGLTGALMLLLRLVTTGPVGGKPPG